MQGTDIAAGTGRGSAGTGLHQLRRSLQPLGQQQGHWQRPLKLTARHAFRVKLTAWSCGEQAGLQPALGSSSQTAGPASAGDAPSFAPPASSEEVDFEAFSADAAMLAEGLMAAEAGETLVGCPTEGAAGAGRTPEGYSGAAEPGQILEARSHEDAAEAGETPKARSSDVAAGAGNTTAAAKGDPSADRPAELDAPAASELPAAEAWDAERSALRGEHAVLRGGHAALQGEHAALVGDHAALHGEHDRLLGRMAELERAVQAALADASRLRAFAVQACHAPLILTICPDFALLFVFMPLCLGTHDRTGQSPLVRICLQGAPHVAGTVSLSSHLPHARGAPDLETAPLTV